MKTRLISLLKEQRLWPVPEFVVDLLLIEVEASVDRCIKLSVTPENIARKLAHGRPAPTRRLTSEDPETGYL